jgi:DNA-binding SARP family transcriptional activator
MNPKPLLRINLFEPLCVQLGERPPLDEHYPRRKAKALFVYLFLNRGRWFSKYELLADLWPGAEDADPGRVKQTVQVLRSSLERPRPPHGWHVILEKCGSYAFNNAADRYSDVEEYEKEIDAARSAKASSDSGPARARYQRAIDLHRGAFLAEFRYDDWSAAEIARQHQLFLEVLEEAAGTESSDGNFHRAIELLRLATVEDPLRESSYVELMRNSLDRASSNGGAARVPTSARHSRPPSRHRAAASDHPVVRSDPTRAGGGGVVQAEVMENMPNTPLRLRLQQEILTEASHDEATLGSDDSSQATALRDGVKSARASASGDLSNIDSARANLGKVSGQSADPCANSAKPITDIKGFARDLDSSLASFQQALEKNDTGSMLRLQKSLADQADQAEANLKSVQSKPAEEVLSAVGAIRTAFAGDTSKLADARAQLCAVVGGSPVPSTSASAPVASNPGFDPQAIAGGVRDKLTSLSDAVHDPHQSPDEIAKRRDAVNSEATKAEAALQNVNDHRADQLRSVLTTAREAAAGDDASLEHALSGLDSALKGQ